MNWSEIFCDIVENVRKEEIKQAAKGLIGWTCNYVPIEIIEALRFIPIRILPDPGAEDGDTYLDSNLCPYIKSTIGNIIEGKYNHLSGMILTNSCDAMRRLFDALRFYHNLPFSFLLDVPRIVDKSSIIFFKDRLRELISAIEKRFSIKMIEKDLIESIKEANLTRRLLRRLFSLRATGYPIRYHEILDIIKRDWNINRTVFNKSLLNLIENIQNHDPIVEINSKRILLTGSLFITTDLIRLIENFGGYVVYTDLCLGERILDEVPLDSDILFSVSRAYLEKYPCARMLDTDTRLQRLINEIEKRKVKGVIYYTLKFCDPYLYETPYIIDRLISKNIRVLLLESEYTLKVSEAVRTRVQAFLETLN